MKKSLKNGLGDPYEKLPCNVQDIPMIHADCTILSDLEKLGVEFLDHNMVLRWTV